MLLMVAAGKGERMGANVPKAWIPVLGKPLLRYSLEAAAKVNSLNSITVLVPPDKYEDASREINEWNIPKPLKIIAGGNSRRDSVKNGLDRLPDDCDIVVIHDAARPFASASLFERVIEAARSLGAATAAIPTPDTVAELDADGEPVYLDRSSLVMIQTPQAFRADLIVEAHEKASRGNIRATDDASLVKALGARIRIVDGEPANFKITYPADMDRAAALLKASTDG